MLTLPVGYARAIQSTGLTPLSKARLHVAPAARRRLACALALLLTLALTATGCGGGGASATLTASRSRRAPARSAKRAVVVRVAYRPLFSLSGAVQDPAIATLGQQRFALLGGIDAAGGSTAAVVLADPEAQLRTAVLPGPQHDAQAATLAGKVYVFGGGYLSELDHILSYDPGSGAVSAAGALPRPASDVAVTESGGSAYIVGGFDGSNWLDTILAWRPGASTRIVGHLPVGLRYAAVTAAGGDLLIIGGSTPSGVSDAVYRFDPAAGRVEQIARLADPITHASAAALNGTVYLVGGRGASTDAQTADVWAIDPLTGRVRRAGRLPQPLSDAGVAAVGGAIIVAGGRTPAGAQSAVGELIRVG